MEQVRQNTLIKWNRALINLDPVPENNRLKITRGLIGCFTHRDNPHRGNGRNVQFQRELDELVQEDAEYYRNPTVLSHPHSGALGSASSSSALGKHPRHPKSSDTSNNHIKATDNEDSLPCHGCGHFGHRRESCDLRSHPDFNHRLGRPHRRTRRSPREFGCISIYEPTELQFRSPIISVLLPLLWMPTPPR